MKNCAEKYNRKDGRILKDFFGEGDNKEVLLLKIKKTDPEDYRTVQNFLQEETSIPREKPVELAAWLIDFRPRPYDETFDYESLLEQTRQAIADSHKQREKRKENNVPAGSEDQAGIESPPPPKFPKIVEPPEPPTQPVFNKSGIWITIITAIAAVAGFLWYNSREPKSKEDEIYTIVSPPIRPVACMIWSVDHYEAIPCDYRYDEGDAEALDSMVLRRFRKITNPEMIGIDDKQKVWYDKQDNKIEFFTDSGIHPVNKKQLKPLSDRIYTYHILPLRDSLTR